MKITPVLVHNWEWLRQHVAWMYRQRSRYTAGEIREELRVRGYAPETIERVMREVSQMEDL